MNYLALLGAIAPVFVIIAAGYAIRRAGWLTADADASLLRVVVNLLYPCLILDTILGNPAIAHASNTLLAPVVGFITVALGYFCSYAAAPMFGIRDVRARRTFAFTTGIYNYGYIALPIVQKLFDGAPGLPQRNAGVLFIHNVGVEAGLWTIGVMILSGASSPRDAWKRVLSVPLLAIVSALLLNFAGARYWMPPFMLAPIHSMGAAAIPVGLILTGAVFADLARERAQDSLLGVSIGACTLRLGALPIAFLLLARFLPCTEELRHVIVVQAAMPCAVIPVILARHYGGDPAVAFRLVFVTTVAGLFTIPLWLKFGLWFSEGAQ